MGFDRPRDGLRLPRSRLLAVPAVLVLALSLAGCGSISEKFGSTVADSRLGLPAGAPPRPDTTAAYPAVHDMPPARPAALTSAEQMKLEDELIAARNRQQVLAGQPVSPNPPSYAPTRRPPAVPAPRAKKPAEPPEAPTSSSRSIY